MRRPSRVRTALVAILQLACVVTLLLPILWLYGASVRSELDIESGGFLPATFTLTHFADLVRQPVMLSAIPNSILVAGSSSLATTALALLAAYSVTSFRQRWSSSVSGLLFLAQILPTIVLVVPLVVLFSYVHLQDSILGLAVAYLIIGLPIAFWLLVTYLEQVPRDVTDAAAVDGCSRLGVLRLVILPLVMPGVVAVAAFAFILSWGEYLVALSLITSESSKTLPLAMQTLFQKHGVDFGLVAAAGVVISLPVAILFILIQRQLVAGLSAGAVKG
jgi:ABC-type glycerol-3-phosphate transport system permease component